MSDMQNQQQLTLFIKQSKVIAAQNIGVFNRDLQAALDEGWVQHGQPFSVGDQIAVNMIKIDERLNTFVNKVIDLAMMQLAELPL